MLERLRSGTPVAVTVTDIDVKHYRGDGAMGRGRQSETIEIVVGFGLAILIAAPAAAQSFATGSTTTTTTHIVEWDLPIGTDSEPGAITVDTHGKDRNRVWFLTRNGVPAQKAYRFDPAKSLMKGSAQLTSWQLSPAFTTGGLKRLKPSDDRRYLFVRTSADIQRVDTQKCKPATAKTAYADASPATCELTIWKDQLDFGNTSDLAVDSLNRIFTTAIQGGPETSYLQMLVPGAAPPPGYPQKVTVTRWPVRGGAGFCALQGAGGPCLSGVDVYSSKYKNRVFYSEPDGNNIGELNVETNVVRRWSLAAVKAFEPRQLSIDESGKVWVVTGSDHVVSLDPTTNRMTAHRVPVQLTSADSDLFGVAPDDDVIGYTNAGATENKVAMVFPKGNAVYVPPSYETLTPTYFPVDVVSDVAITESLAVRPQGKIAPVFITSKDDGTFVEAKVDQARCESSYCIDNLPSVAPSGITPNRGKSQGTFFYTVRFSETVRIGFARLPNREKLKHGRDDDDCDDGEDATMHPGWHDHTAHAEDADDDGVDSKYDFTSSREDSQAGEPVMLSAGQMMEYPLVASGTTLALIANVTSDDPLGQLGVEIYNALGTVVASGVSVGGVAAATVATPIAGTYKVRVKNYGSRSVTHTPTLLVREPWLP